MKKDASAESESGFLAMPDSSGPLAFVYIFNCTALSITALELNDTNVAPQGLAPLATGSPPSSLAISRNVFGNSPVVKVTFYGFTNPSWSEPVSIRQLPMINMYLWCYLNGYTLVDQNGTVNYMFGQSSMNAAMGTLHSLADEWPDARRIISVAL
jgi:hypothetical protein